MIRQTLAIAVFLSLATCSLSAERPAWTSSRIQGAPTAPLPFTTERVFGDFQFRHPVTLTSAPGTDSMFLLEQHGKIYELKSESAPQPRLVADLSKVATGLRDAYGLAFHPDFQTNREIYVCYKRGVRPDTNIVVSRMRLTQALPLHIQPNSEEILYTWKSDGHNGGCVKFGPDGYLYVSAGDASAPFPPDPLRAGQDLSNILSAIVRIDVDKPSDTLPYSIPADNPFVGLAGARPEIYAYGFRNPWRMAFDRETGDLWTGDVGWELWEMIYLVTSGGNYGWSIVEGPMSLHPDAKRGPTPVQNPAASHSHTESRSITGGQVYYGERFPELHGAYIYGDHVTGRIWMLRKHGNSFSKPIEIARSPLQIICFGLHNNGEVYIVDYLGAIHRFARRSAKESNQAFPRTLSESGIYANTERQDLAPGVLPYSVNAEPWMDGATAERFIAIPNREKIGVYKVGSGHANWDGKHRGSWKYPQNSVLGKTISIGKRRVETQLLHFDGQAWQAYSYIWNDVQTDATLADDKTQTIEVDLGDRKQPWLISNRADCMICHSNANDMLLGFKPEQLRRPTKSADDQLTIFEDLGLFEEPTPKRPVICSPLDESSDLESRARAYLHVNCAHCHQRNGGGSVPMDVLYRRDLTETGMVDVVPTQGTFGIHNARVIAPGDPHRSVLLYRFSKTGPGHMPKLGGLEVDHQAANLIHDWIATMDDKHEANTELKLAIKSLTNLAQDENGMVAWLSDARHSMLAAHAMRSERLASELRDAVLAASTKLPATTKDLFESFVPLEARTARLGSDIDLQEILSQAGDAERGKELFLSEGLACKSCHAIQPGEQSVGPNLTSLKPERYRPVSLLENILHPSKEIDDEYRTHTIQTVDGELFTGVTTEDAGKVTLRDAQNKTHTIAVKDIEFRKASPISLMPEKQLADLTMRQARDLLAYLQQLK